MRGFLFRLGIYFNMRNLEEVIVKSLKELIVEKYKSSFDYPSFMRDLLKSIYEPLGFWGRAPNPNNDCETNIGVINIFPHSEQDVWSVLNRFDTNTTVKKKLTDLYTTYSRTKHSEQNFQKWLEKNKMKLFGPTGKYTQQLVDLNLGTVRSGNVNEEFSVKVLKERFPNSNIKRYCSGDIRDTRYGIDITIEHPERNINIQVKPFKEVNSFVEPDGDTFFEVISYMTASRYAQNRVHVFMFVNPEKNDFILFKNLKNKIGQMAPNRIRFYEPPLYTNMSFETKQKRKSTVSEPTSKIFGINTDVLKNLEFRRAQIEKQIEKQKGKISK